MLTLAIGSAPPALAGPVTLAGLTFSDELGGLTIVQGSGTGSLEDPFVLVEDITGEGPAILVIRGMSHRFGNRIGSQHDVGFALTKIVRNRTEQPWSMFNLELRELLDDPSPFGDGLSFGQASDAGRPFRSDRFAEVIETREPYDGVQFRRRAGCARADRGGERGGDRYDAALGVLSPAEAGHPARRPAAGAARTRRRRPDARRRGRCRHSDTVKW